MERPEGRKLLGDLGADHHRYRRHYHNLLALRLVLHCVLRQQTMIITSHTICKGSACWLVPPSESSLFRLVFLDDVFVQVDITVWLGALSDGNPSPFCAFGCQVLSFQVEALLCLTRHNHGNPILPTVHVSLPCNIRPDGRLIPALKFIWNEMWECGLD
jgi:hypothetical protein